MIRMSLFRTVNGNFWPLTVTQKNRGTQKYLILEQCFLTTLVPKTVLL